MYFISGKSCDAVKNPNVYPFPLPTLKILAEVLLLPLIG